MLYFYKAHVERIVDGDTIDIQLDLGMSIFRRERVRLWGIDAPEMRTKLGKEARAYLVNRANEKGWLVNPLYVRTIKDETDKYGRYLAIVYEQPADMNVDIEALIHAKSLDRGSINWQIVEAGHAKERYW